MAAMLEKIEARGAKLAARAEDGAIGHVIARLTEALPGLGVSRVDGGVMITGRRLGRDSRLRWIGALLR